MKNKYIYLKVLEEPGTYSPYYEFVEYDNLEDANKDAKQTWEFLNEKNMAKNTMIYVVEVWAEELNEITDIEERHDYLADYLETVGKRFNKQAVESGRHFDSEKLVKDSMW